MAKAEYFPDTEGQQLLFFTNLDAKVPGYQTQLGITAPQLAAFQNDIANLIAWWQFLLPAARSYGKSVTESRDLLATGTGTNVVVPPPVPGFVPPNLPVLPGALTRLFESIADWKRAPGYTTAIGDDLKIIGPEAPVHADPPELKLRAQGSGWVELNFTKWEHQGIWIESRRQGAETWAFLGIDTARPYKDERPNLPAQPSEWREYRACWWDASTPSMAFGPALRVNVGG